jgi:hypothetical protein
LLWVPPQSLFPLLNILVLSIPLFKRPHHCNHFTFDYINKLLISTHCLKIKFIILLLLVFPSLLLKNTKFITWILLLFVYYTLILVYNKLHRLLFCIAFRSLCSIIFLLQFHTV